MKSVSVFRSLMIIIALSLACQLGLSQTIIDGQFDDWTEITALGEESGDVSGSQLDIQSVSITNDESYFYFLISLDREINLDEQFDLTLYIDADNDASTGDTYNDMGVELEYRFSERYGLTYESNGQSDLIFHSDIDLYVGPTVTSDVYEIAIRRSFIAFSSQSSTSIAVRVGNDTTNGDETETLVYDLVDAEYIPRPYSFDKPSESEFRLVSYNVQRDNWFEGDDVNDLRNQVRALNPDIIAFQEIYDYTAGAVASTLEDIIPGTWYYIHQWSDVMLFSKYPVIETDPIDGNEISLLDIDGEPLVIVNVHLPCCDNDTDRQREVDNILSVLRDRNNSSKISFDFADDTPVIITGDYNLVGDDQQYDSLLEGDIVNSATYGEDFTMEADGTGFADANPIQPHIPSNHTWYNPFSGFTPGKLDLFIYSDASLTVDNTFIMNTQGLPNTLLSINGLDLNSTLQGSDHLPIVADFSFDNIVSTTDIEPLEYHIYPNPVQDYLSIVFEDVEQVKQVSIRNYSGQLVYQDSEVLLTQIHKLSVANLDQGIYYIEVKSNNTSRISQFIKID